MADRWLTFDCYGTIADWNTGMGAPLVKVVSCEMGCWTDRNVEVSSGG